VYKPATVRLDLSVQAARIGWERLIEAELEYRENRVELDRVAAVRSEGNAVLAERAVSALPVVASPLDFSQLGILRNPPVNDHHLVPVVEGEHGVLVRSRRLQIVNTLCLKWLLGCLEIGRRCCVTDASCDGPRSKADNV
jgi:hypothetical protein